MQSALLVLAVLVGLLLSFDPISADPLHDAARKGDIAAVKSLLDEGAEIDKGDGEGKTALYHSVKSNHLGVVELLLDRGANPNQLAVGIQGPTDGPIHVASEKGYLDVIRVLAAYDADLFLATTFAPAPLHLALQREQDEAAELLRSLGAGSFKAPSVDHLIASSDVDLGGRLVKGCNRCHAITKGGEPSGGYGSVHGPALWGIVNREKAGVSGWEYSDAMRASEGTWTYSELNNFIANPTASVPGTKMWFSVKAPELRAAIIAYLRTLADQPSPLP